MKLTLRKLLSLTILVALTLFIGLGAVLFTDKYTQYRDHARVQQQLALLHALASLNASLAEERGLHVVNRENILSGEMHTDLSALLKKAIQRTDTLRQQLLTTDFTQHLPESLKAPWRTMLDQLSRLPRLRQQPDSFSQYSQLIEQNLLFQQRLVRYLPSTHLQQDISSMITLEHVREQAGQERGLMMHILSDGQLDARRFFALAGHINQQQLFMRHFLLTAPSSVTEWLTHKLDSGALASFNTTRTHLFNLFDLQQTLNTLLVELGYAGFIHNFKNYVLRGDPAARQAAETSYRKARETLHTLQHLNLSAPRQQAVTTLMRTLETYHDKLSLIDRLHREGVPIREIDRRVKVDDRPAIAAIATLRQLTINITPAQWWREATHRIQLMTQAIEQQYRHTLTLVHEKLDQLRDTLIRSLILFGSLLLVLLGSAGYSLWRMGRLTHLAERLSCMIRQREYTPLSADGNDEISQLTETFNALLQERKRYEQDIWRQSNLDPLTQLPNRAYLLELLNFILRDAQRNHEKVAVLFLDLDGFKAVNDTEGHRAGDELLEVVAGRLRQLLRKNDLLARIGGDEFIIVLPHVQDESQAMAVADKVIHTISQPIRLNSGRVAHVSASVGVTFYPDDGTDVDTLLMHADMAMYHAKDHGKNQAARYDHSWSGLLHREQAIVDTLNQAAQDGDFAAVGLELHYQPIVNIQQNHTSHLEALLRWQHPILGPISPMEFIPVAERSQLIIPLGNWVVRQALAQAHRWQTDLGRALGVAVNLSPAQARDRFKALRQQLDALKADGMDPALLDLEITENLLMDDSPDLRDLLNAFRQRGCRLFLDDFGTGYSSLSYLKRYPFDVVKIDRAFIRDMHSDPQDRALIDAILSLAEALGLRVVAEGVETAEQLDYLRQHGCHYVQGYHLARPMDADTCTRWLHEHG